jgi:DNA-binding LytR/AlgR family response regulator
VSAQPPTALIAEDEPLLRAALRRMLEEGWPELRVVGEARNGREAVELFEALAPDICFLDVHMPGLSGVEAARFIGRRAQLVFVTAFDQYAVQAFEQGALDYLVKPVEAARLADTIARLQERLRVRSPRPALAAAAASPESLAALASLDPDALLEQLVARLRKEPAARSLRWLRVSVGRAVKMVAVDEIDFLRSDEKYTLVAWRSDGDKPAEGLIRTPLKELLAHLDPTFFAQVHRAVVVNLRSVSHVTRDAGETADLHLKGRDDVLPVSRSYLHLFRQM